MVLTFHVNAILFHSLQEVKRRLAMAISFSVKVAAEQIVLSERSIHAAIKRGDLQAMRVGRRVLITPLALKHYLYGRTGTDKEGAR
jgi:excisionase family DNA binding protein